MLHSLRSGYLREDEDDDDERSTETMTTEKIRRGRGIGGKVKRVGEPFFFLFGHHAPDDHPCTSSKYLYQGVALRDKAAG